MCERMWQTPDVKPRRVFPFKKCSMCERDNVAVYRWVILGEEKGNWGNVHWYEFLCDDCAKSRKDVMHEG